MIFKHSPLLEYWERVLTCKIYHEAAELGVRGAGLFLLRNHEDQ
jgi:hypothetical protein